MYGDGQAERQTARVERLGSASKYSQVYNNELMLMVKWTLEIDQKLTLPVLTSLSYKERTTIRPLGTVQMRCVRCECWARYHVRQRTMLNYARVCLCVCLCDVTDR